MAEALRSNGLPVRARRSHRLQKGQRTAEASSSTTESEQYNREGVEAEDVPYHGPHALGAWSEAEAECLKRAHASRPPAFDAQRVDRFYSQRPALCGWRALQVLLSGGGLVLSLAFDAALGRSPVDMATLRGRQLRQKLTALGPAYVKLGQALSTRQDLLPAEYINELSTLQDSLDPFSSVTALELVEHELGMPLERAFRTVTPLPYASASIGQVHKAQLHNGNSVALKIQRPGIRETIFLDFFLLRRAGKLFDSLGLVTQSLADLISFFGENVVGESDYISEARNAERFRRLYVGRVQNIRVPEIEWSRTSSRVLCMEWINGSKLTDPKGLREQGLDPVELINIGIESSITQLLFCGEIHGDSHPSNVYADEQGSLTYIDFGVTSAMPRKARYALTGHVVHLINRDFSSMCRDYVAMDFISERDARTMDFAPIEAALASFFNENVLNSSVSSVNISTIVGGLGSIFFAYPFRLPSFYQFSVRLLTYFEGIALSIDPTFKLFSSAYPLLAQRLLTGSDNVAELQNLLEELLFENGRLRWDRAIDLLQQANRSISSSAAGTFRLPTRLLFEGSLFDVEAVRILEAFAFAPTTEAASLLRTDTAKALLPQNARETALRQYGWFLSEAEEEEMRQLRGQVQIAWQELQLAGVTEQLSASELTADVNVREFVGRAAARLLQRIGARSLRVAMRSIGEPLQQRSSVITDGSKS
jgi:predicted unusual protein kinase regulating ubiquinone biosynthesis (AarF/ABC1/UbiB family)